MDGQQREDTVVYCSCIGVGSDKKSTIVVSREPHHNEL